MELAGLEPDRLPDQYRLFGCRQVEQAETALVITVLSELAEGQPFLDVGPFPGLLGAKWSSQPPLVG